MLGHTSACLKNHQLSNTAGLLSVASRSLHPLYTPKQSVRCRGHLRLDSHCDGSKKGHNRCDRSQWRSRHCHCPKNLNDLTRGCRLPCTIAAEKVHSALAADKTRAYDILLIDLSKLLSVRETAAAINESISAGDMPPIRALILIAGYCETGRQTWTEDGFDTAFASNHLGHRLLTLLLLQSVDRRLDE